MTTTRYSGGLVVATIGLVLLTLVLLGLIALPFILLWGGA